MSSSNTTRNSFMNLRDWIIFIVGVFCLAFILGSIATWYNLWPTSTVGDGLEFIESYQEKKHQQQLEKSATVLFTPLNGNPLGFHLYTDKNYVSSDYTLINMYHTSSPFLINSQGKIIYTWNLPFQKIFKSNQNNFPEAPNTHVNITTAQLFPNGDLLVLYSSAGDTPYGYGIAKVDKVSKVIWSYKKHVHHQLYVDKEYGDIYALTHEIVKEPFSGLPDLTYPMLADYIVKLSAEGKELQKISIIEAFRNTPFEALLFSNYGNNVRRWDFLHSNSVMPLEVSMAKSFPMFHVGDILVSLRNINTLAVISPETGKVIWAFNGIWKGQHSASFLPNGHILLLDNNGQETDQKIYSRALEFDPRTLGVYWYYAGSEEHPFHTYSAGVVHRLNNGNTLIAESRSARVFEVTAEKKIVWDYTLYLKGNTHKKQRGDKSEQDIDFAIADVSRYDKNSLEFLQEKALEKK